MTSGPQIIPRKQHTISRQNISENALKVLYRLRDAGFEAYLVGGSVRDLLLGERPKDFDIVTSAHPEQVRDLFRNARLIGRRFRLAHILFGREIIEVATFRSAPSSLESVHHQQSETGQLVKDNVYGTVVEDALRRDFTINSLYYSIDDFTVRDYVNGLADLQQRQLRLIGDPEARYREDPVRMLRALRFAAKLDFSIAPETAGPIPQMGELLAHIPGARLFDEIQKIFTSGYAGACWELLTQYQLVSRLFPFYSLKVLQDRQSVSSLFIAQALRNTDERIQSGKHTSPSFLFAILLWHPMLGAMEALKDEGLSPLAALQKATQHMLSKQLGHIAIPRRFLIAIREMWELQLKLPRRHGDRAEKLLTHPRFRAAYDFLLLREQAGEIEPGLGEWWRQYQEADHIMRNTMSAALSIKKAPSKKRQRRSKAQSASQS